MEGAVTPLPPILPDTDVLIDYLRGDARAVALVAEHSNCIILSPIVVAELYAGVRGEGEERTLREFVSLFPVVELTVEVATAGGLLRREYGRSHGVGLPDALLAATAMAEGAELKTLNVRHYPMLKELKPAYAK
jgi:predicted nucleic acid-binding protein